MRDIHDRVISATGSDPVSGHVVWHPAKSLWYLAHLLMWVTVGSIYFSFGAVLVFILLAILTLCGGHSLGMHRQLIHESFECPLWLTRLGVYLGTLVGLGGPFTMMRAHDMRDWAQRQDDCHAFFSQHSTMGRDWLWQIHCKLNLMAGPRMVYPKKLTEDPFMIWLQRTAWLQQIPLAIVLLYFGDWGWVAWGVSGRIIISITGHWLIGWFAHNQGPRNYHVQGHGVQGFNVPGPMALFGFITFGECWHNNHHAFPESARIGHKGFEVDPGWWVLCLLEKIGFVENLVTPDQMQHQCIEPHPLSHAPLPNPEKI
ncbi:delta-9 desaturase [Litorimonas cladophorae]|uniref:Delta-9 desaturase n=1 Tax=Litorimonas cladophorae TaxID=1220491 RepID=A0A918KJ03_9PROT|nr:acyl-CoA desaturase [Litorimonas cladophorae]GGX64980.1 delta-9 desaturase [Litorimonas cladophorae]